MAKIRSRGEGIRTFILENVEKHSGDISRITADRFKITRQAVNKHMQKLVEEGSLAEEGKTRNRFYKLAPTASWDRTYDFSKDLAEDVVWTGDVSPVLGQQPENVLDIWQYCFTEMFNNAISHSAGTQIYVIVARTAVTTEIGITDNGIGIFKKIQAAMNLLDERHAILELAKGKLTTDPASHTGEGIFFTSRMLDSFEILSGGVYFSHAFGKAEDWIVERDKFEHGTTVFMKLSNHTSRTAAKILHQYTSGEDFGFTKTVVPVTLAQYGNDKLVSRSQAKRVLARVELFKTVVFDFRGVPTIGQAFADEIFRVFPHRHPEMQFLTANTNSEVKRMIARARAATTPAE